jgi:two-component system, cell cycle sensor histidine kinase and response regulator CckA
MALDTPRMDKKLHESEQWLSIILQSLGDAVMATDTYGGITVMNPRAEGLTGWTQAEAVGRHVLEVLVVRPEAPQARAAHPIVTVLQEGTAIDLADHRWVLVAKDGTERPIDGSAAPITDAHGTIIGAVLRCRDTTERRQLQERLVQTQTMEAIGRLADRVAHDFNNVLTVISVYTELLLSSRNRHEQLERYVTEIKKAVDQATTLTGQLRMLSRTQLRQPRVLALNGLLAQMADVVRHLLGPAIELILVPRATRGYVNVDPAELEQVIRTLVMNAHDAMTQGGTLTLETADIEGDALPARRAAEAPPGPSVLLAVRDTGCGMDAATRARLFEPFFTTKSGGHGTGLGLSLAYGIVRQSGGHIDVDSAPGRGAVFRVYLPRVEPRPGVQQPRAAALKVQQGSETVLLVEDDDEVRAAVCESLQGRGYTVLHARHGTEAVRIGRRHAGPIHLLVTDVVMSRMTGPQLARRLFRWRPEIKVLYVSGYTSEALAPRDLRPPGTAFLQKPFTPEALARHVRAMLDPPPRPPTPHTSH